jgi:hypothetical protein
MENLSALEPRHPVIYPERMLFEMQNGTWFVETIRASGQMRRVNRPDTRLHLTIYQTPKKDLQSRSHPHRTKHQFEIGSMTYLRQAGHRHFVPIAASCCIKLNGEPPE